MSERAAYIFGALGAVFGVVVTVTNPDTLENIVRFPQNLSALLQEESDPPFDKGLALVLVEEFLQDQMSGIEEISEETRSKISSHLASKCIERAVTELSEPESNREAASPESSTSAFDQYVSEIVSQDRQGTNLLSMNEALRMCEFEVGLTLGAIGILSLPDVGLTQHVENPSGVLIKEPLSSLFGRDVLGLSEADR
ncbi:hypothetical protein [Roseobacter denitrificans]|uniref:hypothetical protein n=1 Tax=Roseobacter denitrificans TaxID=2434 RepID=UPI0005C4C178|nr:hypothetical protein [Roseobacter denitrificans]